MCVAQAYNEVQKLHIGAAAFRELCARADSNGMHPLLKLLPMLSAAATVVVAVVIIRCLTATLAAGDAEGKAMVGQTVAARACPTCLLVVFDVLFLNAAIVFTCLCS